MAKAKEHTANESRSITPAIIKYLNSLGGYAEKRFQNAYQQGKPDIDFFIQYKCSIYEGTKMYPGAVAYKFETKRPGKEPTDAQKIELLKAKAKGIRAYKVSSLEEVKEIMIKDGFDHE